MDGPDILSEIPQDASAWVDTLDEALAERAPLLQELADRAVRECPAEHQVLHLAALASLVGENPERCQRYLTRIGKRYDLDNRHHLLWAIALAQQRNMAGARELLRKNDLDSPQQVRYWFFGDASVWPWLADWMLKILGREPPPETSRQEKRPRTSTRSARPAYRDRTASVPAAYDVAPLSPDVPELPCYEPAVPIRFELLNANDIVLDGPVLDGNDANWYRLRADLAHLSLLREFDELLCLPLLHQVETVRKVLRSFRGRVLLADEVGLGKTVEAGMVLKEYLLRGMVQKVLILTPPSLVGQWQEEMATKFDIPCATSHESLLRADPEAFWAQPRVIASIASARRQEHFARLSAQEYDVILVDEAHPVGCSPSYFRIRDD